MSLTGLIIHLLQTCAPSVRIQDAHGREPKFWWNDDKGVVRIAGNSPGHGWEEIK